jgi:hypothetical protein
MMPAALKRTLTLLAFMLVLQASSPRLFACAACFGQSDSNLAKGMNIGIMSLLLVIVTVLGGVASFFLYLARRSAAMETGSADLEPQISEPVTEV